MNRIAFIVVFTLVAVCGIGRPLHAADGTSLPVSFTEKVDLRPLEQAAVHADGRVKSLDSFTRSMMKYVSGSHQIKGQSPTFTYFDLMLRPQAYADEDIIYFKNKLMRAQIAQALRNAHVEGFDHERENRFMRSGLLSVKLISEPAVMELLNRLSTDVLRNAKLVDEIDNAMGVMNSAGLRRNLKLIAPPAGGHDDAWFSIDALSDNADNGLMDASLRDKILAQWASFDAAWTREDAPAINDAAAQLAALLSQVNPEVYPAPERLAWESWYFRAYNMTWIWTFYALAMIPLMLGVVFRWRGAHWTGMGFFVLAWAAHTFAVMLRWYVAQRWPNSNMFEAITTAAWFGGCLALVLELIVARGKPMRGLFALGSAIASMTALMAVKMYPMQLNPEISNMMPVLNDLWLYIHTNVIIFSYCLIFIAAVTAAMYLLYRAIMLVQGRKGIAEYARVGGAGSLIMTRPDGSSYMDEQRSSFGQILDGTTMVVMEMSFILLWAGIVMGAIWADHSWGRPWGWDPKEVFALNTFLVFLVLVHGRMKVKDKGLWTATMALLGAAVMLFNWIIINFAISGLHSYA